MFGNLRRPLIAALAVAIGIAAAPVEAQVTATMVLKNGQRHTGQNLGYRLDRPEMSVRTSLHEEPRVPESIRSPTWTSAERPTSTST